MHKNIKYTFLFFTSLLILASAQNASAAIMYLVPEQASYDRGQEFTVDVKIDSEQESINAAEAKVTWPSATLELGEASKTGSVFNFWVQEPEASESNSIIFTGGAAKGLSGPTLQIVKIKFRALGSGVAEVTIADAAITAADGKGTNVLSKVKGATFRIGAQSAQQPSAPAEKETPQPIVITRPAVAAKGLPVKPVVSIPLYSDQEKWHNQLGEMVALWDVPQDVSHVAVALDHNPNTTPATAEKELVTGKKFGVLEDGVWYVHVRFRNNIGWGPVTHYKVAIDTAPPLAFEITTSEGETTDNPAPILQFKSSDALSGLAEYQIRVNGGETIKINAKDFNGSFTLPLQPPGLRNVVVSAFDQAQNSTADDIKLEILPIPSPNITFTTRQIFSDEENGLTVKGTALPNITILLQVYQLRGGGQRGETAAKNITVANEIGNWEFTFDKPLRNGQYVVVATGQDKRGALSLEVESAKVTVKSRPIIQFGFLQLGKGSAALFLLLLLVGGFGGGVWYYKMRQGKLELRVSFAESEITKIFGLLKSDVENLKKAVQTPTPSDDEYEFNRIDENFKKMEAYIKKGVEKIKK